MIGRYFRNLWDRLAGVVSDAIDFLKAKVGHEPPPQTPLDQRLKKEKKEVRDLRKELREVQREVQREVLDLLDDSSTAMRALISSNADHLDPPRGGEADAQEDDSLVRG